MKRMISLVLVLAMLLSTLSIGVYADWSEANPAPVARLVVTEENGSNPQALLAGQQVRVKLLISGLNKYWSSVQYSLRYNDEAFSLDLTEAYGQRYFDTDECCKDLVTLFGSLTVNTNDAGELKIAGATDELSPQKYGPMLLEDDTTYTKLREIVALDATFTVKENYTGAADFEIVQYDESQTNAGTQITFYELDFTKSSGYSIVTTSTDDLTESVNVVKANSMTISGADTIAVPEAENGVAQTKTETY